MLRLTGWSCRSPVFTVHTFPAPSFVKALMFVIRFGNKGKMSTMMQLQLFLMIGFLCTLQASPKLHDQAVATCTQQCRYTCSIHSHHASKYSPNNDGKKRKNFYNKCMKECVSNCNGKKTSCMNGRKLVIISLDGFANDYLSPQHFTGNTTLNLTNINHYFIENGAWINGGLIPIFPSKTYPSHYSIVTGMYPKDHGIVSNVFFDPILNDTWDILTHKEDETGKWYLGEPIWNTAKIKGLKSGAFYFPGSLANCSARDSQFSGWPDYYETPYVFNWGLRDQMDKALDLLLNTHTSTQSSIPPSDDDSSDSDSDDDAYDEYSLILLYFYNPDWFGHVYGPESDEVRDVIETIDGDIGYFMQGLEDGNLIDKTDIILLSDHGMAELQRASDVYQINNVDNVFENDTLFELIVNNSIENKQILVDSFVFDYIQVEYVVIDTVIIFIYVDENVDTRLANLATTIVNEAILVNGDHCQVYLNGEIPQEYHFNYGINERTPDVLMVADIGYTFLLEWNDIITQNRILGNHGYNYDENEPEMAGILMATGPSFKKNYQNGTSVDSIHLYSLFCHLLCQVEPNGASNGSLEFVKHLLA